MYVHLKSFEHLRGGSWMYVTVSTGEKHPINCMYVIPAV